MEKLIVLATVFLAALSALSRTAQDQTRPGSSPAFPIASLPKLELHGSIPTIFATLVKEANLSGGVAGLEEECLRSEESMSITAGTNFDTALASFAKLRARSTWQHNDGVANLFPTGAVLQLLQVQIASFTWDATTPIPEVIAQLRRLPEVTQEVWRLGLREAPFEGGGSAMCVRGDCTPQPRPQPSLKTEKEVPLVTLLNRIVRAHKGGVWDYEERRCGSSTSFSLTVISE